MNLIDGLKNRKFFRAILSYGVVAFVILQLVEIIFPILDFPKWTSQLVIILLLLGFPLSLMLVWMFDQTSEEVVKTDSSTRRSIIKRFEYGNQLFYAQKRNIFLAVALAVGIIVAWITPEEDREAKRITERSIAVLPFDNLSDRKQDEYFSDGITEEIITQLSKISDLMVISRLSVLQYKSTTKTIREIGNELGVAAILEGSVQRDGENLRITGQLIDADNDKYLWADTYDRNMEKIFEIQTDVAMRIADVLDAKISDKEKKNLAAIPTQNLEAYNLYLKGRSEYFKSTYEGFEKSIDYYRQALKLDPYYALAYSGMGNSYGEMFLDNQDELYSELAIQSSERALSINIDLAEGYNARALISSYLGHTSEAIDLNKRAIELGYVMAESNLGLVYWWRGDLSESLKHHIRGRQSDPYNLRVLRVLALTYHALEDYEKVHNLLSDALDKHPDGFEIHDLLITQYCVESDWAKARTTLERLILLRKNDTHLHRTASRFYLWARDYNPALDHLQKMTRIGPMEKTALAFVLLEKWERIWANTLLDEVIEQQLERIDKGDISSFTRQILACAYSVKGEKELAIKWLEEAVDKGLTVHRWIEIDPRFDSIRNEPSYRTQIRKMKAIIVKERLDLGYPS